MNFVKKLYKSFLYFFFEVRWNIFFKLKYFFEKTLQFFVTVINSYLKKPIKYPFFFNKDYVIENRLWKFFIKSHSDYDYPILPYVEDDHDKFMDIWENKIFLDIWWHVGTYSIKIAHYNKKNNVKIFCFEPHPETYKVLSKNIHLNHLENAIVSINKWVFSKTTKVKFTNTIPKDAAVSKIIENDSSSDVIEIEVVAIDDFIREYNIDVNDIWLIKVDVEWLELEVFVGMSKFLSKTKGTKIVCEILDKPQQVKVFKYLEGFWFKIKKIDSFNFLFYK